jgi:hypothetical protein
MQTCLVRAWPKAPLFLTITQTLKKLYEIAAGEKAVTPPLIILQIFDF